MQGQPFVTEHNDYDYHHTGAEDYNFDDYASSNNDASDDEGEASARGAAACCSSMVTSESSGLLPITSAAARVWSRRSL